MSTPWPGAFPRSVAALADADGRLLTNRVFMRARISPHQGEVIRLEAEWQMPAFGWPPKPMATQMLIFLPDGVDPVRRVDIGEVYLDAPNISFSVPLLHDGWEGFQ